MESDHKLDMNGFRDRIDVRNPVTGSGASGPSGSAERTHAKIYARGSDASGPGGVADTKMTARAARVVSRRSAVSKIR